MTQAGANGASSGPAPRHIDFLLVGGGLASPVAAQTLRAEGATGSILILSAEDVPPYHHTPLSKHLLAGAEGAERIFVHPESFYGEHRIELTLGTRVSGVDTDKQTVTTARGERIRLWPAPHRHRGGAESPRCARRVASRHLQLAPQGRCRRHPRRDRRGEDCRGARRQLPRHGNRHVSSPPA